MLAKNFICQWTKLLTHIENFWVLQILSAHRLWWAYGFSGPQIFQKISEKKFFSSFFFLLNLYLSCFSKFYSVVQLFLTIFFLLLLLLLLFFVCWRNKKKYIICFKRTLSISAVKSHVSFLDYANFFFFFANWLF